MKSFLKKTAATITVVTGFVTTTGLAHAQLLSNPGLAKSNDINEEITFVIQWILGVAFTLAVLALIIGGFIYVLAGDDSKRVDAAKAILTSAITGLVVILLSYVIAITINTIFNK